MPATVVFGAKPCGARGFLIFDRVYQGKKFPDPYYKAARDATVFVTMACAKVENTCFCHWVGSGPADPAGSDVLLTPVGDGYTVEAVSDKGAPLLDSPLLTDGSAKVSEAEAVKTATREAWARRLISAPRQRPCSTPSTTWTSGATSRTSASAAVPARFCARPATASASPTNRPA
jgi:hypothetical protein